MKKVNQEIYDLLSNPEAFDTAIALIKSFDDFKTDLLDLFGKKIEGKLRTYAQLNNWVIRIDEDFSQKYSSIYVTHGKDVENTFCYCLANENSCLSYGIWIDRESKKIKNLAEIFQDAKRFKDNKWKIGNEKDSEWPIWYSLKEWNFQKNETFKNLLPSRIDENVKDICDLLVEEFDINIQNFIISHLTVNKIIN